MIVESVLSEAGLREWISGILTLCGDEKGERERGSASKRTQTGRKWKTATSSSCLYFC